MKVQVNMSEFREYREEDTVVRTLYENQRKKQCVRYVLGMRDKYRKSFGKSLTFDEVFKLLDEFPDLSDPDMTLPNSVHAIQAAEAARESGAPDWMVVTALLHDVGKVCALLFGNDDEGTSVGTQWGIVGDTRVLGRPITENVPYPDIVPKDDAVMYRPGCGMESTLRVFGHDDMMAMALERMVEQGKCLLPDEAIYIVRFHSCYPHHRYNEYIDLENGKDRRLKPLLKRFNQFDLYSKSEQDMRWSDYSEIYMPLLTKYFPDGCLDL